MEFVKKNNKNYYVIDGVLNLDRFSKLRTTIINLSRVENLNSLSEVLYALLTI